MLGPAVPPALPSDYRGVKRGVGQRLKLMLGFAEAGFVVFRAGGKEKGLTSRRVRLCTAKVEDQHVPCNQGMAHRLPAMAT